MLASLAKDPADAALLEELLCLLKQAPFDMVEGLAHREVVERPVSWTRGHLRSSQRQYPSSRDHDAVGKSSCTKVAPRPSAQRQPPPRRCRACAGATAPACPPRSLLLGWFDDVVPRPVSCASGLQCLVKQLHG